MTPADSLPDTQPTRPEPAGLWASHWATQLARATGDIALLLSADGLITEVASGNAELPLTEFEPLIGRSWPQTVSAETRGKADALLHDALHGTTGRRREVNQILASGSSVPLSFSALRAGPAGTVLAMGRDLRAVAALQQRFLTSQHELEREVGRLRATESRYRLLFQVATDAVFIVDPASLSVVDANGAAAALLDLAHGQVIGQSALAGFELESRAVVERLLRSTLDRGAPAQAVARLAMRRTPVDVSVSAFRAEGRPLLLMRARPLEAAEQHADVNARLARLVQRTPDAIVVTDDDGRVMYANPAFVDMAQAAGEMQVRGRLLHEWLGRDHTDARALLWTIREQGLVRRHGVSFASLHGERFNVDVSGALLAEGEHAYLGLTLRRYGERRRAARFASDQGLSQALETLAGRLGLAPLPDLAEEATTVVETHLVLSALARAGHDRDAAAVLLGISREQLDFKLARLEPGSDAS